MHTLCVSFFLNSGLMHWMAARRPRRRLGQTSGFNPTLNPVRSIESTIYGFLVKESGVKCSEQKTEWLFGVHNLSFVEVETGFTRVHKENCNSHQRNFLNCIQLHKSTSFASINGINSMSSLIFLFGLFGRHDVKSAYTTERYELLPEQPEIHLYVYWLLRTLYDLVLTPFFLLFLDFNSF